MLSTLVRIKKGKKIIGRKKEVRGHPKQRNFETTPFMRGKGNNRSNLEGPDSV